jgi:hypothetical protein
MRRLEATNPPHIQVPSTTHRLSFYRTHNAAVSLSLTTTIYPKVFPPSTQCYSYFPQTDRYTRSSKRGGTLQLLLGDMVGLVGFLLMAIEPIVELGSAAHSQDMKWAETRIHSQHMKWAAETRIHSQGMQWTAVTRIHSQGMQWTAETRIQAVQWTAEIVTHKVKAIWQTERRIDGQEGRQAQAAAHSPW